MLTRTLYLAALLGTALVDAAPPLVTVPTRVCTVGSAQFSWDRTQLPAYSGNIWRVSWSSDGKVSTSQWEENVGASLLLVGTAAEPITDKTLQLTVLGAGGKNYTTPWVTVQSGACNVGTNGVATTITSSSAWSRTSSRATTTTSEASSASSVELTELTETSITDVEEFTIITTTTTEAWSPHPTTTTTTTTTPTLTPTPSSAARPSSAATSTRRLTMTTLTTSPRPSSRTATSTSATIRRAATSTSSSVPETSNTGVVAAAAAGQGSNTGRTVDIAVGVTVGVLALLAALLALLYFRQRNAPRTRPHKALPDLPGMRTVNPTLPTSTSNSPYGDWGTMQRNGVVGGGEYDYDAFAHHRSAPSLAMIEAAGTSGQAGAYLGGSAAQYALGGQSLGAAATSVYSTNAAGYGVYGAGIAAGAAAAAHDPYAAYDQNRAYNPQDSDSSPIDFSSHAPYGDDVYGSMSEENPHSRASIGGSSNDHFYPALSSVPDLPLMSDEGETGSR